MIGMGAKIVGICLRFDSACTTNINLKIYDYGRRKKKRVCLYTLYRWKD